MHKTLNLDELIASKQLENAKKQGNEDVDLEEFYDLIIPPGVVMSVIIDLVEQFDLEPITRKMPVTIANSEEREVLVLRGNLENVQAAEKFLYEEMKVWIEAD